MTTGEILDFWLAVCRNLVLPPRQPVAPSAEGLVRFCTCNEFIFWVFKYLSTELGDEGNLGETLTQSSGEICLPSLRDRQWSGLIAAGREESSDQRQHEFGGIDWK